jgi:hypothetical protein
LKENHLANPTTQIRRADPPTFDLFYVLFSDRVHLELDQIPLPIMEKA